MLTTSPWQSINTQFNSFVCSNFHGNSCNTTFVFTGFTCVLDWRRVGICSVSILVGAKSRMRLPLGIAPCENGSIPVYSTLHTDWYLWDLSLGSLPLPSPFGRLLGSEVQRDLPLFLSAFVVEVVLEAAPISSRTLFFRGPLSTISIFSVFARCLSVVFKISSWVSCPGCCSLKSTVFIADMEIHCPLSSAQHNEPFLSIEHN